MRLKKQLRNKAKDEGPSVKNASTIHLLSHGISSKTSVHNKKIRRQEKEFILTS